MIISICNQKGGTSKSTTTVNLAACFAAEHKRTLLIDADVQQSALTWKTDRPEGLPEVHVIGLPAPNLHREVKAFEHDYDVVLVDGGGRITATARAACIIADFIVVPMRPSKPDILSTEDFLATVISEIRVMKDVNVGIVVTFMRPTIVGRAGLEKIERLGYPVFNAALHDRVAYQEAMTAGMSVVEYDKNSKASGEVQALYSELKEAL